MPASQARKTFAQDGVLGASLNPSNEPEAPPRGYLPITGRAWTVNRATAGQGVGFEDMLSSLQAQVASLQSAVQ